MSTLEKKALAFEKLAALKSEEQIGEILEHLKKFDEEEKSVFDLSKHFNSISEKYDETLKKLAQ